MAEIFKPAASFICASAQNSDVSRCFHDLAGHLHLDGQLAEIPWFVLVTYTVNWKLKDRIWKRGTGYVGVHRGRFSVNERGYLKLATGDE